MGRTSQPFLRLQIMQHNYSQLSTNAIFRLTRNENSFNHSAFEEKKNALLTIVWNPNENQMITIDGKEYSFPKNTILPLTNSNTYSFERPTEITAWQFNREFYCIVDHDKEISCAGFIFYGSNEHLFIKLDEIFQNKIELLFKIFIDELNEEDNIQGEMLRMLLKRLIILITRLGKQQYNSGPELETQDLDIVRQFNLEVERHFRELHQVQDYASLLNKSPKTLSNLFSKHNQKTPLQIIRERITLEAKRLMLYTDSTLKEIAYDLGFDDPTGFSRFFKNQTGSSPSTFRKNN